MKSSSKDGEYECYSIDIEMPGKRGSQTLDELTFSLNYVSADVLQKAARDLIKYDENTREIEFDLGDSFFKYKLGS